MSSICHLTSVHERFDVRIFLKECRSLATRHAVTLVVADGLGNEKRDGVTIFDVGKPTNRWSRVLRTTRHMLNAALALEANLYHIHDPELLWAGLALKRRGKRVIFDAHEDLPAQIMSKPYLSSLLRPTISSIAAVLERAMCRRIDGIVAATPYIRDKFLRMGVRTIDINNYPLLGELQSHASWSAKQAEVCYVGGIAASRGILEIVRAMAVTKSKVRLNLAGKVAGESIEASLRAEPAWQLVNEHGFVNRDKIRDILTRSVAGLVTLHPLINYIDSLPIKMFEYMSAGIPVIASDFPLWREILIGNDCGILVDPMDPTAISVAIDSLVGDRALARRLGENGAKAVLERYNWTIEEKKLFQFYSEIGIAP